MEKHFSFAFEWVKKKHTHGTPVCTRFSGGELATFQ